MILMERCQLCALVSTLHLLKQFGCPFYSLRILWGHAWKGLVSLDCIILCYLLSNLYCAKIAGKREFGSSSPSGLHLSRLWAIWFSLQAEKLADCLLFTTLVLEVSPTSSNSRWQDTWYLTLDRWEWQQFINQLHSHLEKEDTAWHAGP